MLLPLYTDQPLRSPPVMNWVIIGLNLLMFALQKRLPAVEAQLMLYAGDPGIVGIFGHAFLHGGWLHLIGNMVFLYIFGNAINDTLGNAGYLGFYLGGAAAAATAHILLSDSPALGASGAVAACSGAYLALYPRSRVQCLVVFVLITTISVPAVWFVGLFAAIDLFFGFGGAVTGISDGVARFAHLGGTTFGVAVALLLMRLSLVKRHKFDALAMVKRRKLRRQADPRALGQAHRSAMDVVPIAQLDPREREIQELRTQIHQSFEAGDTDAAADIYTKLLNVDDRQVLSPGEQLKVAESLLQQGKPMQAAVAYERFLERHARPAALRSDADRIEAAKTRLMLGLVYSRYTHQPEAARPHLSRARDDLTELGQSADADFAGNELAGLPQSSAEST
ncbi:MAG: rhomboid family intramembrane serine protease [Planctomycetota bacterium]